MIRRSILGGLAALLAGAGLAQAQAPFDRPTRIVVGFAAGGTTDITARVVAEGVATSFGHRAAVDIRTGASGFIAAEYVARSRADGGTVLLCPMGPMTISPELPGMNLPIDVGADLVPVANVVRSSFVVVTGANSPHRTLEELIAAARARPGALNYGTPGIGSVPHLATELLAARAGIRLEHVPYRGSGPLVQDLLAGRIELTVATPVSVLGHVRAGRLRALAVAGPNRIAALPDVPTAAEAGLPGLDADAWFGCHVARGTPGAVAARLAEAVEACVAAEAFRRAVAEQGAVPRFLPGPALQARAERELREWTELARANSIRLP